MTHEELIHKIITSGDTSVEMALFAVVEIHKPRADLAMTCSGCSTSTLYPCQTINAIEKVFI